MELSTIFDQNFIDPNTNLLLNQIAEPLTKTVGSGKDFATLDLALNWYKKKSILGIGTVDFVLDDGTHTLTNRDDYNWVSHMFFSPYFTIKSASGIPANCIITVDPTIPDWYGMFLFNNGTVFINQVTIDTATGGHVNPENIYAVEAYDNGRMSFWKSVIKNCQSAAYASDSIISLSDTKMENCVKGSELYSNSRSHDWGGAASGYVNCTTGISCNSGSRVALESGVVFTGNTTDTNSAFGEITQNGSAIFKNGVPVSLG